MSTRKRYLHSLSWSDECATGDGMCDGTIPEGEDYAGEECGCSCHNGHCPATIQEVAQMHREDRRLYGPVN